MFVELVRIESLSNNSYVVGSEQSGRCIVIDPARDVDRYVQIAANHGTRGPGDSQQCSEAAGRF